MKGAVSFYLFSLVVKGRRDKTVKENRRRREYEMRGLFLFRNINVKDECEDIKQTFSYYCSSSTIYDDKFIVHERLR